MTNKVGVEYKVANGVVIEKLREKRFQMKGPKSGKILNMAFRVVSVHKPLLPVSKILEQGHKVALSKKESYTALTSGKK